MAGPLVVDAHAHNFIGADIPITGYLRKLKIPMWLASLVEKVIQEHSAAGRAVAFAVEGPEDLDALILEIAEDDPEIAAGIAELETAEALEGGEAFGERGLFQVPAIVRLFAEWAVLLATRRRKTTRRMFRENPGVDAFVTLMVDMEYWLGDDNGITVYDQVDLIADLSLRHPGRLLPFVGFCPAREAEYPDPHPQSSLALVKRAVGELGFVGVKIYPPMGYAAIGNEPEIEAALHKMFDWCLDNDVPITAHCSPEGAEAKKCYGEHSDPAYWRKLVDTHERFRGLRLNLAHFAGVHPDEDYEDCYPDGNPEDGWRDAIAEMMENCPKLYTDTGYHRIFATRTRKQKVTRKIRQRYFKRLGERLAAHPVLAERLMYGSDWHMTVATEKVKPFARKYRQAMHRRYEGDFSGITEAFMGGNALAFLDFGPGGANRARYVAFLEKNGAALPEWLE